MQKESSKTAEKPKPAQTTIQKPSIISNSTQKTSLASNNLHKQANQVANQNNANSNIGKDQATNLFQKIQVSSTTKQNSTQAKSDIKKVPTNDSQSQKIQSIYLNQSLLKNPAQSNDLKKSDQKIPVEINDSKSLKTQTNNSNQPPQKKIIESNVLIQGNQKVAVPNNGSQSQKSQTIQAIQVPQKKQIESNSLQKNNQKTVTENDNSQSQNIQATQVNKTFQVKQTLNEPIKNDQKVTAEKNSQKQKSELQNEKDNLINSSSDNNLQQIAQINDEKKQKFISSKSKFLEIFGEVIINKIMSFFMIEDYVKAAAISRYFRKKVPQVLATLDYTKKFKQMNSSQYLEINQVGKNIVLNSISYNKLIKNSIQEIQKEMNEFQAKKKSAQEEVLLDIFTKSCNFFMKTNQNKSEIIKFILSAGIETVFQPLSQYFIQPSKTDLKVPQIQEESLNTPMIQLLKIICQYFNIQQSTNKEYLDNQRQGVRFYKLFQHISKVQKVKSKLIDKYERPIMYLRKDNNAFNYINKNTIQVILPFLNAQDIIKLCQVSKKMHQLIQTCCQNMLERLHEDRKQLLSENKISDDQAKAAMYLEHYTVFNYSCQGLIPSYYFQEPHLKELIYALWQLVKSEHSSGEIYINSKNPQNIPRYFQAGHNLYNANAQNISILDECLQKYTDDFVEKGELQEDYYRNNMILLQKYLKGIKLFIELNLNDETFPEIQNIYQGKIMKIDKQIYQYQKICKQKTELLSVFTFDFNQPFKEMRIKDIPRRLFD
ncbi:F-box protein (macronuclear) [Tetrahymena thermophila SB210]|uniref:F-box protein n=1 Tax=Tetrahymena thermophila (strain SB210) TaxID=312017 RepID=Q22M74_TETTS|nr:F-box protein [Tetrahymena thermophila SB210]EAR86273.2 F-box protein [Tetrahymena thermophila SB210]|eukprot:XP_977146.2 F-box protein [Tetrahymena thermophila SB210]